ncbi:hypothetical protein Tco_0421015 [Tanacetum coccineum]
MSHCFMPLVTPATGGSSSAAAPEVSALEVPAPAEVEPENVVPEQTYLDLTGPDEVVATQPGKSKRKSARITDVPVYTAAATVTSAWENLGITSTSDVAGSSQLETSEGSDDSFYELPALNYAEAKRYMEYEQLYTEFNVGAARQICLESEVRSRVEHELELKEKLKGRYDARSRLLEEKYLEILRLKSLLAEEAERAERAETAEVVRFRDQVSVLTAEVSALKITIAQKDTDISLLDSRATHLKSALDDSQAACAKAGSLITSLTSERDRLSSEVSTLHAAFQDFKEKAKAQQEERAWRLGMSMGLPEPDTLTPELLAGPTFKLMKGTCKSLKPLPLIPNSQGRQVIPFAHFINNDLTYLSSGVSSRTYSTSVTKTKAANYGNIKWIEDLVPSLIWSKVPHLNWITIRKDDDKLYSFKEGDFKWLRFQDIEDMLILLVQGKLTNLKVEERLTFSVALRMFTRSIVIQRSVEALQLGVESYQKKLKITKPDTYRPDLRRQEAYTAYPNPQGFIYQNGDKKNRLMHLDELDKFSDSTLNDVRTALDDRLKGIQMEYLP